MLSACEYFSQHPSSCEVRAAMPSHSLSVVNRTVWQLSHLLAFLGNSFESQFPPPSLHSKSRNSAMELSENILHYFDMKYFVLEHPLYAVPQSTHRIYCEFPPLASFPRNSTAFPRNATEIIVVYLSRNNQYLRAWS